MEKYARPQVDELVRQITDDDFPLIVAITGPRQTGKTTMIRQALERVDIPSRYFAVDDVVVRQTRLRDENGDTVLRAWLLDAWEKARRDAERSEKGLILALDEIQNIEGWSLIVKAQWDRDRRTGCPLRVIVSGSAPWSLLTGLHESLAGRFMPVGVHPWSFSEMAAAFDFTLDQYLCFGGYPGVARLVKKPAQWRGYVLGSIVASSIERDVVALARVEKPVLMRRLVELASQYSGQILSYNKMLGQLQEAGNTSTLADYLDLLSDAGLATGLSKYSAAPYIGRGSSPKLNVLNTALMTAPLTRNFEQIRADTTFWGRIVESAVGAHLHNTAGFDAKLYYWREGVHEVDFVVSGGLGLVGIEVKSGRRAGSRQGREAFEKRFDGARTLLVGDRGVPLEKFLSKPARYWAEYQYPPIAVGTGSPGSVRERAPEYAAAPQKYQHPTWRDPIVPGWKESEDFLVEDERRKFMAGTRKHEKALRRGEGSPWLWHRIGRAYMGAMPEHFEDDPIVRLRLQVQSDEGLLASALAGLPRFPHRDDLPPLDEIVRLDGTKEGDTYSYPILAGLEEAVRLGGDALQGLDADGVTRAVGCYYLTSYIEEPSWYPGAIQAHPDLCAEALVAVYRSLVSRRINHNNHLFALCDDPVYTAVARLAAPTLLGVFPTRCTKTQVSALHALLWAALLYLPKTELAERVRRRAAARGMDPAQRALWLAAGLFLSAKEHRPRVVRFVDAGREPRARHMFNFMVPGWLGRPDLPEPWDEWETRDIAALVKALGRWYDPWWGGQRPREEASTLSLRTDWLIKRWLEILGERPEPEAAEALDALAGDRELDSWYEVVEGVRAGSPIHPAASTQYR